MVLTQKVDPNKELVFEYNFQEILTMIPDKQVGLITKNGYFAGDNEIEWKIQLQADKVHSSTITIDDEIPSDKDNFHKFNEGEVDVSVTYAPNKNSDESQDVSDSFTAFSEDGIKLKIAGDGGSNSFDVDGTLTFTFKSKYSSGNHFKNEASAVLDEITTDVAKASVSLGDTEKSYKKFTNGKYNWEFTTDLSSYTEDMLANLEITDTLSKGHEFQYDPEKGIDELDLKLTINDQDVTNGFDYVINEDGQLEITVKKRQRQYSLGITHIT
ncbi:hypothetical protein [Secundilactobacillus collinoides]|uniref:hypothetical protein n=1 Tax=Secundilactobacillus collinoides TaxID=33960 RepID=UPI0006CF8643|nr:hypothetical protein [Secundilactobacillus collinoides]